VLQPYYENDAAPKYFFFLSDVLIPDGLVPFLVMISSGRVTESQLENCIPDHQKMEEHEYEADDHNDHTYEDHDDHDDNDSALGDNELLKLLQRKTLIGLKEENMTMRTGADSQETDHVLTFVSHADDQLHEENDEHLVSIDDATNYKDERTVKEEARNYGPDYDSLDSTVRHESKVGCARNLVNTIFSIYFIIAGKIDCSFVQPHTEFRIRTAELAAENSAEWKSLLHNIQSFVE
jgi:hypothetical protein